MIKQHFLKNNQITTLGLLVCGEDPFEFLNARAEVNCYYDTDSGISRGKKIFRNDVISLMEMPPLSQAPNPSPDKSASSHSTNKHRR